MSQNDVLFSVFTKPWMDLSVSQLGAFVSGMGFNGVEFPVRPGYQVEPENVGRDLPELARQLADYDVRITSVAGPTDEATMAACAEAGVPLIRICVDIGEGGYMENEARAQREFDTLVPLLDKHAITLGIQNHSGRYVCNAMGMRHLMEKYDPRHIAAVWCAAHNALDGESPDLGLDIVWSHLSQVKFKNAFWRRKTGPEAEDMQWSIYWTSGRQGLAAWPLVADELKKRCFKGVVCLDAEYTDHAATDRLIAADIAFAKSLF